MTQYGFFVDLSRCIGCNACTIACKEWHQVDPGPAKWMRVYQWEKGAFPEIEVHTLPMMCLHCQHPVCADACPNHAITKEEKYGSVQIDASKCTGERKCLEACPYGAPQYANDAPHQKMSKCNMCIDRLEQGLNPICVLSCSMRALEFGPIEKLKEKYGNSKRVAGMPTDCAPCRIACPAGVDAGGYIRLIAEGKTGEALMCFRDTSPFAGILGRVCVHPCEVDCQRGKFDESISVCSLKRYMADAEIQEGRKKAKRVEIGKEEKIAIIGSGPGGLSAAYDLIRLGYPVTVFESAPLAGGLMRYGIPEYRLPRNILNEEIGYIQELGVEIRTSSPVKNIDEVLAQGYKAVFLATGAPMSLKLDVPGEDAEGVTYAIDFLQQVNSGKNVTLGKKVVVIGGGSVAIDAARVALRLGAKEVHLTCLERRDLTSKVRMPAQSREIQEAEDEGVIIHPSKGIRRILTENGKTTGIETMDCLSVFAEDGTFSPQYDQLSVDTMDASNVIVAIGQTIDKSSFAGRLKCVGGVVAVDMITLETNIKGVFAGGDMASGAADIISAVAAGKKAAISIDRFLSGADLRQGRQPLIGSAKEKVGARSHRFQDLAVDKRNGFAEVEQRLEDSLALEQAQRCLRCGVTVPSVVFRPEAPKKQIIPWDGKRALSLWQKRHTDNGEALPDVFDNMADVVEVPEGTYLRNKLVLKPANAEELMNYTTDDE